MEDVAPPFFQNGRAQLAPTFQWGNRIGTPPPNLAYPAFLNTNPTQDVCDQRHEDRWAVTR